MNAASRMQNQRLTRLGIALFAVLLASYVINAMDRQLFPILLPNVRKEYDFSLAGAGLLSTVFTAGMAVAGIPTGYLLARLSRKAVILVGIFIFSAATVLTVFSAGFADMLFYRAVTGLGEAMQLTALLAVAAGYFAQYRGAAVGAANAAFATGTIVGPSLGSAILGNYHSWRAPMIAFGVFGLVAIIVILPAVPRWLTEAMSEPEAIVEGAGATTLLNRNTVLLVVASILGGLLAFGYLGMYPTFLRERLGFTPGAAGAIMSIYGIGALFSIAGGWVGDRLPARAVLCGAFAIASVLGYALFHGPAEFGTQAALSFCFGLVVSGTLYVNLAGYSVKAVAGRLASKASGLFVTSLYGPATFAGYIIGWIVTHSNWHVAADIEICMVGLLGAFVVLGLPRPRIDADSQKQVA